MMSEAGTLLEFLSASSDVALVLLVYMIWRLDRRVLAMEIQIKSLFKQLTLTLNRRRNENE